MTVFILDCSVTMSWCFFDEGSPYVEGVLNSLHDHEALVPPLWVYEVCNVLVMAERHKRLSKADSSRFLNLLLKLPIVIDEANTNMTELLTIARNHKLTSYDAAYLELALRTGLPIATLDNSIKKASHQMGLALFSV